jgi:hypothetical protein
MKQKNEFKIGDKIITSEAWKKEMFAKDLIEPIG